MPKIIVLTNCSACPYLAWSRNNQRACRLSGYRVIDVAVTAIPSWCELEDCPEVLNEAETKTDQERKAETVQDD